MKQSEILCASLSLFFVSIHGKNVPGSAEQGRFIIHFQKRHEDIYFFSKYCSWLTLPATVSILTIHECMYDVNVA